MASIGTPVAASEPKPYICFRNADIKKYIGKEVDDLNVGDEISLTLKFKVTEVHKSQERVYDEKTGNDTGKMKPSMRVEMDVVGGSNEDKDELDEYMNREPGE